MLQVQGNYKVKESEYIEAQDEHVGSFTVKATRVFGLYLTALSISILILRPHAYALIVLLSVFGLWSVFGRNFVLRRWHKRDFRNAQEWHVSMSDKGVSFVSEGVEVSCHWNKLLARSESKNTFLLYLTERTFYIVPQRAFEPGDLAQAQQLVAGNVGPKRVPWFRKPLGFSALLILVALLISMVFLVEVFDRQTASGDRALSAQRA